MGRKNKSSGERRTVIVVNLSDDPELAQQIDQRMVSFGLDSRSNTVKAMLTAHCSAYPVETEIAQVALAAVRESRNAEYAALREFHLGRAALFGGGK